MSRKITAGAALVGGATTLLYALLSAEPTLSSGTAPELVQLETDMASIEGKVASLSQADNTPRLALRNLFGAATDSSEGKKLGAWRSDTKQPLSRPVVTQSAPTIKSTPDLLGIVIRDKDSKAFFTENDKLYALRRGDVLKGQYRIVSIREKKVVVKELSSGLKKTIFIKE